MKFLFFFSCLLLLHTSDVLAQDEGNIQLWTICNDTSNYRNGSQFETNLKLLLNSLVSNVTRTGFLYTSVGANPNKVDGLIQCRGDLSVEQCRACSRTVTTTIIQSCANRKEAVLLWDHCIVRYSSRNFSSQLDNFTHPGYGNDNRFNGAVAQNFDQQLRTLMVNMSTTAASRPDRFSYGQIFYTEDNNIYGMTQCNQDLSTADCRSCLLKLLPRSCNFTCNRAQGYRLFSTTCWMRYEIYRFLDISPSPPIFFPPPQPTPTTETTNGTGNGKGKSVNIVAVIVPVIASAIIVAVCAFLLIKRRNKRKDKRKNNYDEDDIGNEESQHYDLNTIKTATDDFSAANKLGQGGFGSVYKGQFLNGQEIAVKRLSKNSGQGSQEFKNEVVFLLKLQHRNLVRLLGYCMDEKEKLLIYEYLPNRSLDHYIFDPARKSLLDWETRYKIIGGIARGLLYLHEDSRLRIVHRDLKSGNILLDKEMNAKIADFGLAKLFEVGENEIAGNTNRIAGTYGYMAPEYALSGLFSPKSDVYSFGVLLLEIVSGLKTISFHLSGQSVDLLSHAWKLWRDGNALELIDPTFGDNYSAEEIMRCIHIGLLCVQDKADDRPTMSNVALMLTSYSLTLGTPATPTFIMETVTGGTYTSTQTGSTTGSLLSYVDTNLSASSSQI